MSKPQVYALEGVRPVIHPTAYVHPTAVLIGDAVVGPRSYVGPFACMRGDFGRVELKEGANLQDHCMMHCFPGVDCIIEEDGHIGHGAILHGCIVARNAMVGMNSVVMDGAVIGDSAMVAAMAFVKAGFEVPPRTLAAGTPAKIMRDLSDSEIAFKEEGTRDYQRLSERCLATLQPCDPLTALDEGRPTLDAGATQPLFLKKKG